MGAVEAVVFVVVAGDICEVLHVNLEGGGCDAVAVIVVDPGACCVGGIDLATRSWFL